MKKLLRILGLSVVGAVLLLLAAFVIVTSVRFERERRAVDAAWRSSIPAPLADLGSVSRLRVLPLVEATAVADDLRRGIGVSYLIQAGDTTILFDVAGNPAGEPEPPVMTNAGKLGVDLTNVGAIVISHLHPDHVGDLRDLLAAGSIGDALATVPLYLPEPIAPPPAAARVLDGPSVIAPGVASLGPIAKTYWGMGTIVEQALAINVEGLGLVLVIGCGHQSVIRVLERAEAVADGPVYGVLGGLHFPTEGFPGMPKPIALLTRLAATGEQPCHGALGDRHVSVAIRDLQARHPAFVGVSPHDTSASALALFRAEFGARFREVEAGREVVVTAPIGERTATGPQGAEPRPSPLPATQSAADRQPVRRDRSRRQIEW